THSAVPTRIEKSQYLIGRKGTQALADFPLALFGQTEVVTEQQAEYVEESRRRRVSRHCARTRGRRSAQPTQVRTLPRAPRESGTGQLWACRAHPPATRQRSSTAHGPRS